MTPWGRLLLHTEDGPVPERGDLGPCLLWTGYVDEDGYGRAGVPGRRSTSTQAHRLAYTLRVGPIPDGYQIDHLCRVRRCIQPEHLEAVPARVNAARSAAGFALTGLCLAGLHDVTIPGAIGTDKRRGKRYCIACRRETARRGSAAYRARQKARDN